MPTDFTATDFDAAIKTKGYNIVYEKSYICPCKSFGVDHQSTCKNCGGYGFIFANPTRMRTLITGIELKDKLKDGSLGQWGTLDIGYCMVTAYGDVKLTFMDRITNIDATAEHQQVLHLVGNDDGQLFAFTQYTIKSIDFIGLYEGPDVPLKRLIEPDDYSFNNNIITLDSAYNDINSPRITVRYVHNPTYHIVDIIKESRNSRNLQGNQKIVLPVHALARRAHLVVDSENYNGDRLLNNSWLPDACQQEELTQFERQVRYNDPLDTYNAMTPSQQQELRDYLAIV